MIQRVDYNPYAYLSAQTVDGISAVAQKPIKLDSEAITTLSFDDILANVLHNPYDPRSRYEQAMIVQLGLMHNAKYFDYGDVNAKLRELRNIAETSDYSGMSDADKVMMIYNRWDKAFGDFRQAAAVGSMGLAGIQTADNKIMLQFINELTDVFGNMENVHAAYRTAQYGNMSNSEIRAEIANRYPSTNKITLRDFYHMVWEMEQVGVDEGLPRLLSNANNWGPLVREELLDKPLDVRWLCDTYNSMRNAAAKTFNNDVGNSGIVLKELFSVVFDGMGNAYGNPQRTVDYSLLINQAIQKYYENWTVKDYEKWFNSLS